MPLPIPLVLDDGTVDAPFVPAGCLHEHAFVKEAVKAVNHLEMG